MLYDHNCDKPEYPITILQDPEAAQYVDGSAFHLYAGDVSALGVVKNGSKKICISQNNGRVLQELCRRLHLAYQNVIIGTMRNWSKIALEWNLANDAQFQPLLQEVVLNVKEQSLSILLNLTLKM